MAQVLERTRPREVYIHGTHKKPPPIGPLPEQVIHPNGNGKLVPDPPHDWLDDLLVALSRPRGPYTAENAEVYLDEEPVELYNGWLVVDEMSHFSTHIFGSDIIQHMSGAARLWEAGRVLPDQVECLLSDGNVIKPDLCLISNTRIEERVKPHGPNDRLMLRGCPELVLEIRSPSNRRTQEKKKRELYFKDGAEVIWDVDEDNQIIHVYRAETPEVAKTYSGEDEIDCEPFLPAWRRKVSDLFAEEASVEVVFKEVVETFFDKGEKTGRKDGEKIGEQRGKKIGREEGKQLGREEGEKIGEQRGEKIGREEGEKIGREEGEKIGRQEGEKIGKQDALIRLLEAKFTTLPEQILETIQHTDNLDQLDSWFGQALTVQGLDQMEW